MAADYLYIRKPCSLCKLRCYTLHLFLRAVRGDKERHQQAYGLGAGRRRVVAAHVYRKAAYIFIGGRYRVSGQHSYPAPKVYRRTVHPHMGGADHFFSRMSEFAEYQAVQLLVAQFSKLHLFVSPISSKNSCSFSTLTPSSRAFVSLLPALSPART